MKNELWNIEKIAGIINSIFIAIVAITLFSVLFWAVCYIIGIENNIFVYPFNIGAVCAALLFPAFCLVKGREKENRFVIYVCIIIGTITLLVVTSRCEIKLTGVQSGCLLYMFAVFCFSEILVFGKEYTVKQFEEPEDWLFRKRGYNTIVHQIRHFAYSEQGVSVAVKGEWGAGKSHFLSYLKSALCKKNQGDEEDEYKGAFRICEVNLWQMKSEEEAWDEIASSLEDAFFSSSSTFYKLEKIFSVIVSFFLKNLLSEKYSEFGTDIISFVKESNYFKNESRCKRISNAILAKKGANRMLLVIDDVERADFKIIKSLLPLLDKLKNIHGLVVICSFDPKYISKEWIKAGYSEWDFTGYLLKLFDASFVIPKIDKNENIYMRDACMKKYNAPERIKDFFCLSNIVFDTPRQIQRSISKLASLQRQYGRFFADSSHYKRERENENIDWNCIYLVSLMKLFFSPMLQEIERDSSLLNYKNKYDKRCFLHGYAGGVRAEEMLNISDEDKEQMNKWKQLHPDSAQIIETSRFAWSLLTELFNYANDDNFAVALHLAYAQKFFISDEDTEKVISRYTDKKGQCDLEELIDELYPDGEAPKKKNSVIKHICLYAREKLNNDMCFSFLALLFRRNCRAENSSSYVSSFLQTESYLFPLFEGLCKRELNGGAYLLKKLMCFSSVFRALSDDKIFHFLAKFIQAESKNAKSEIHYLTDSEKYQNSYNVLSASSIKNAKIYVAVLRMLSKKWSAIISQGLQNCSVKEFCANFDQEIEDVENSSTRILEFIQIEMNKRAISLEHKVNYLTNLIHVLALPSKKAKSQFSHIHLVPSARWGVFSSPFYMLTKNLHLYSEKEKNTIRDSIQKEFGELNIPPHELKWMYTMSAEPDNISTLDVYNKLRELESKLSS